MGILTHLIVNEVKCQGNENLAITYLHV